MIMHYYYYADTLCSGEPAKDTKEPDRINKPKKISVGTQTPPVAAQRAPYSTAPIRPATPSKKVSKGTQTEPVSILEEGQLKEMEEENRKASDAFIQQRKDMQAAMEHMQRKIAEAGQRAGAAEEMAALGSKLKPSIDAFVQAIRNVPMESMRNEKEKLERLQAARDMTPAQASEALGLIMEINAELLKDRERILKEMKRLGQGQHTDILNQASEEMRQLREQDVAIAQKFVADKVTQAQNELNDKVSQLSGDLSTLEKEVEKGQMTSDAQAMEKELAKQKAKYEKKLKAERERAKVAEQKLADIEAAKEARKKKKADKTSAATPPPATTPAPQPSAFNVLSVVDLPPGTTPPPRPDPPDISTVPAGAVRSLDVPIAKAYAKPKPKPRPKLPAKRSHPSKK